MARKINKAHPDCAEYKRKWNELWRQMEAEIEQKESIMRKKFSPEKLKCMRDWSGSGEIRQKYAPKFRELQERYSYLYYEE